MGTREKSIKAIEKSYIYISIRFITVTIRILLVLYLIRYFSFHTFMEEKIYIKYEKKKIWCSYVLCCVVLFLPFYILLMPITPLYSTFSLMLAVIIFPEAFFCHTIPVTFILCINHGMKNFTSARFRVQPITFHLTVHWLWILSDSFIKIRGFT